MANKKREQKPLKREFSAGGVVYRKRAKERESKRVEEVLWLLIQPAGTNRWQLPKGNIEEGESAKATAVREVWEETGVQARIIEKIDVVGYFYVRDGTKIAKSVTFFLMEYKGGKVGVNKKAEHEIAEAKFVSTEEALALLTFRDDKEVVRKADERLRDGIQESLV